MGYSRPDGESKYLAAQLGNRWQRLLLNGQIFNWFADFAAQESKIDRDRIVKRLRVFSSRHEAPTAFWVLLMTKFYEEGAHLGLRKYVENGVTYYCPPHFLTDFKMLCQATPTYKNTLSWVFRPDYLSGRIFAHVFCPGKRPWFRRSWPEALKLRGERYLVSYYRAGIVHELLDTDDEEDTETCVEGYRNTHSLLCLIFGKKSRAAFDIASEDILTVVSDPYLGISSSGFNSAALQLAALCVYKGSKESPFSIAVIEILGKLAKDYPQLESGMDEDSDYMYRMTYSLMPMSKKSYYASIMADFEVAMKAVVIENADEISTFAKDLKAENHSLHLNIDRKVLDDRQPYPVDLVRQYLANVRTGEAMALEAFDTLLDISDSLDEPSDIVSIPTLKSILRERTGKLTELIEATGEFLVTGPLIIALLEVGQVSNLPTDTDYGDYGDLVYRTKSDRPWLETAVKFAGETNHLEYVRNEFLAYCRIITG
jgi:hypothetical protein